ncbi:hypothetical protein Vafri_6108, partial [Volvox africanus]
VRGGGDTADAAKAAELSEVPSPGAERSAESRVGAGSAAAAASTLRDGDVLMVLDCGGGTTDITMHRVVGSGAGVRLQEATAGEGVIAGGRFVDAALWRHLRCMLGDSVWATWQQDNPTEWMQTAADHQTPAPGAAIAAAETQPHGTSAPPAAVAAARYGRAGGGGAATASRRLFGTLRGFPGAQAVRPSNGLHCSSGDGRAKQRA